MSCMSSVALGYCCLVMMRQKCLVMMSSRINSEVCRDILSAQIQSNAAKLIERCFRVQMHDDPKHTAKASQKFVKVKQCNILQ